MKKVVVSLLIVVLLIAPGVYQKAYALTDCNFLDNGNNTWLLQGNCTTDTTIIAPHGYTVNGQGYNVNGVDPFGGHFVGAVLQAPIGGVAHFTNITVSVSNLADFCDEGTARLRGILFENAGGSVTNSHVLNIRQGVSSGCQEGNAIEIRNAPFDNTGIDVSVTISGNTVTNYQKTGILANGSVGATISNNVVTGVGPVNYIAQNGIQIGFGGTATIAGNTISGNNYTPESFVSCGILFFQADGVKASKNTRFDNERDQCNFGKGGGTFNPSQ